MYKKEEWKPWQKSLVTLASFIIVIGFLSKSVDTTIKLIGKSK